ncbi:MAG TPA: energy transducer TonB [Candidatus Eisenbacteria bacterium]|nr:energy transducer TonB [Candidatus Eisenbacteria bacterium]
MRGSILGSGVLHVAALVALFYVHAPVSIVVPGPEVVQVALVDPNMVTPPTPPPVVTPPEEPKAPEVKPEEDTGVKLKPEPPPKLKKKPEKPREEPPPPQPATALPSAAVGSAGLKGDLSLDVKDFEFTYYLILVRNRIAGNWAPPAGLASSGQRVRAVVYFRISRGGEVSMTRLEETSGMEFFDRSALRAVTISDPMPPLPLGFAGGDLGIHFGFDWVAP